MVADLNCNDNNLTNVGTINGIDIDTINSNLNMMKLFSFVLFFVTVFSQETK